MKNKLIIFVTSIVVSFIVGTVISFCTIRVNGNTTTSEANIPSETKVMGLTLEETNDLAQMQNYLTICDTHMQSAHEMAERARELGYDENHTIIQTAKAEWNRAFALKQKYETKVRIEQEKLELQKAEERKRLEEENKKKQAQLKKEQQSREYPTAAYVWNYLKQLGYNDYVCAGIIGNFMAETGGQTLNIQWNIQGNGYYGMAQWSKSGHNPVWGKDLQGQCAYLQSTIAKEFNIYGNNYYKGFNYNAFLNLQNEQEAALAFAKCYERCGSGSYSVRKRNATTAYNYFVN